MTEGIEGGSGNAECGNMGQRELRVEFGRRNSEGGNIWNAEGE